MKRNKLGYDKAMQLIYNNKIEYQKEENGRYRIKVSNNKNDTEFVRSLIEENARLKEKLELIKQMI